MEVQSNELWCIVFVAKSDVLAIGGLPRFVSVKPTDFAASAACHSTNRVKMQLWLHVPYYSTKSPYIGILYYILLHFYVAFHYLATRMSVCGMVNPLCSILKFLASRRVDVLVLFQARVKHGVMQPSATQQTLDSR